MSEAESTLDPREERDGDAQRRTPLDELRSVFTSALMHIQDDELADDVDEWLRKADQATSTDAAAEYVEYRLTQVSDGYEMYHSPDVEHGEDAFPDECVECPHYGVVCPVLEDSAVVAARRRDLADAETEKQVKRVYQRTAAEHGCRVIKNALREWDEDHRPLIEDGRDLHARVREYFQGTGGDL